MNHVVVKTLKQTKRLIVIVVGFTVLTIWTAMLVLPGPAFIVIPLGLAILASEFVWARRLLSKMKPPRAYARGILHFSSAKSAEAPSFALRASEGPPPHSSTALRPWSSAKADKIGRIRVAPEPGRNVGASDECAC
jgi:tellurite resistance protein TerC